MSGSVGPSLRLGWFVSPQALDVGAPAPAPSGAPFVPRRIDLVGDRAWPLRNQRDTMKCTAYAAAACLELVDSKGGPLPNYSDEYLYQQMLANLAKDRQANPTDKALAGTQDGQTRFKDAAAVIRNTGYCDEAAWSPNQMTAPKILAMKDVKEREYPPGVDIPGDIVLSVYNELAEGRPVGVGITVYVLKGPVPVTNWQIAQEHGFLPDVSRGDIVDRDHGHAVCIVGYIPNAIGTPRLDEGFFVFRNSLGNVFPDDPTTLPTGYGKFKAALLKKAARGFLFMA